MEEKNLKEDELTPAQHAALVRRLRKAVEQIGTQVQAAHAAGVSERQLRSWLNAHNVPKALALSRLAKAAGVSTDWILTGEVLSDRPDRPKPPVSPEIALVAEKMRRAAEESERTTAQFQRDYLSQVSRIYRDEGFHLDFDEVYEVGSLSCDAIIDIVDGSNADRDDLVALALDAHRAALSVVKGRARVTVATGATPEESGD